MNIITVIGLVLACIVGIWKFVGRLKLAKRKIAKEAKDKLDEACKDDNPSDFLDSWDSVNRM